MKNKYKLTNRNYRIYASNNKKINMSWKLIQRGGGTGPMKPQQQIPMESCANSCKLMLGR